MARTLKWWWYDVMYCGDDACVKLDSIRTFTDRVAVKQYRDNYPAAPRIGIYAIRQAKPSPEMLHVLDLASRQGTDIYWVPLVDGKGSQSRTVGRQSTIEACRRRGWLDFKSNLTQSGREVLAQSRKDAA